MAGPLHETPSTAPVPEPIGSRIVHVLEPVVQREIGLPSRERSLHQQWIGVLHEAEVPWDIIGRFRTIALDAHLAREARLTQPIDTSFTAELTEAEQATQAKQRVISVVLADFGDTVISRKLAPAEVLMRSAEIPHLEVDHSFHPKKKRLRTEAGEPREMRLQGIWVGMLREAGLPKDATDSLAALVWDIHQGEEARMAQPEKPHKAWNPTPEERAVHDEEGRRVWARMEADPEFVAGMRRSMDDVEHGRMIPWEVIQRRDEVPHFKVLPTQPTQ
jgi:hypothetical protein